MKIIIQVYGLSPSEEEYIVTPDNKEQSNEIIKIGYLYTTGLNSEVYLVSCTD